MKIFNALIILIFSFVLLICIKGQTGQRIVVMEIDTGIDAKSHIELKSHVNPKEIDGNDYEDLNNHGTHIAGLILNNVCKEVEIISCSYYKNSHIFGNMEEYLRCLNFALEIKPNLVNISAGGNNFIQEEYNTLKKLSDQGTIIIVSAGNNHKNLKNFEYYPANYKIKNLITVGSIEDNGLKTFTSNWGKIGMVWEKGHKQFSTLPNGKYGLMSGTSMSTAIRTNRVIKSLCKKQGI